VCQWVRAKEQLIECIADDLFRVIFVGADLFSDDGTLFFDVARSECWRKDQLEEDIHKLLKMLCQAADVVAR